MEPLDGYGYTWLSLGVEKDQEEQQDMRPTAEERKDEEEGVPVPSEAKQREAAEEEKGEKGEELGGGEGQVGTGAPDPIDDRNEESSGSSSSGDQEQEELIPEEDENGRDQQWLLEHTGFTQLQLQELENYLQSNRSPSRPER
ncbi:homeobox protein Rhox5-like, partial [Heterocephalus glaber]|uniref:Homeobox protein Rhox5-like n=1 Tax=Heterocephalus glaber TaxID=10181 RepID=A0AAX6QHX7_HETGA